MPLRKSRAMEWCCRVWEKAGQKDWFIYQAGGLLMLIIIFAGCMAGAISFLYPLPSHIKVAVLIEHLERSVVMASWVALGTAVLDQAVLAFYRISGKEKSNDW